VDGVHFGYFVDQDATRYCSLRLRLLKAAVKDVRVADALMEELGVKVSTGQNKMKAIERRIEELKGTKGSLWYEVPGPEILAASIFRAKGLAGGFVDDLFRGVRRVQDLASPVLAWLRLADMTPHDAGSRETGRANVVGYRPGAFGSAARIVGIEVTNDASQIDRALDEMKASKDTTHATYLACTPALAATFLWTKATARGDASRWDAEALQRGLRASGCGLLFVEGDAVAQAFPAKERTLDKARLAEIAAAIGSTSKVRGS
jgi:hypothetical protein